MQLITRVKAYIRKWRAQGYPTGIPDEVPDELTRQGLAPSYKAIALALLKNDRNLESLGFSGKKSPWYSAIKRVEIEQRNRKVENE